MARPRFHTLVTLPLAWAAHRRWGAAAAAAVVAGGILVDGDHLVDFAWTRFTGGRTHYFAPLHSWELASALAAVAAWLLRLPPEQVLPDTMLQRSRTDRDRTMCQLLGGMVAGLALGLWVHLIQDVLTNRPRHAGVYALLYRIRHRFRREATGWNEHSNFHGWSHKPWYTWY